MKHIEIFDSFLTDVVDLNSTRLSQLESRSETLIAVVEKGGWKPPISEWLRHGSWAHQTIIKPVDQGEFDADLVLLVQPVEGWSAKDYIDKLYALLSEHGTYSGKVARSSHCVTINYANDCKVDIAPCVVADGDTRVCNRNTDDFESTRPKEFTEWLIQINGYLGRDLFRKVTRLLKYLRDIKTRFTCSSVLLTTLLAKEVRQGDANSTEFVDVPTALRTLVGRLDLWLQERPAKPSVLNPHLSSEDFAAAWSEDQYKTFRENFHRYRQWIDEAFDETDESESLSKWQRVFGDDFGKKEATEAGRAVEKAFIEVKKAMGWGLQSDDPVELVKSYGVVAIPSGFEKKPYIEQPRRRFGMREDFIDQNIHVTLHEGLRTPSLGTVVSGTPLRGGKFLCFRVFTKTGSPLQPTQWLVDWRVTNTGSIAANSDCLRGRIEDCEADLSRWEALAYRGIHFVEAFAIEKRRDRILAKTRPFYVVIE